MQEASAIPAESIVDTELLQRIRQRDEVAFGNFYDRHAPLLYSVALRIVGNEKDAEDVLQESAVQVWERARNFDPVLGSPISWALTITRNKAIDRIRATKRRGELLAEIMSASGAELAAGSRSSERPAARDEDVVRLIQVAMGVLTAEQRQAIEAAFFGGLTQTEIAAQLGEPLGTIKARIRRGMLALRAALKGLL